jgi:hypothetical protein
MINAITAAQNQSLGQYAAAGGLATESLSAIRTVSALNAQPDVITRYRVFLFKAMQVRKMSTFVSHVPLLSLRLRRGTFLSEGGSPFVALSAVPTSSDSMLIITSPFPDRTLFPSVCTQVGIQKGFNVGLGNGGLFCACFFTYALGFWYGGQLVADSVEDGCSGDGCVNGGKRCVDLLLSHFLLLQG